MNKQSAALRLAQLEAEAVEVRKLYNAAVTKGSGYEAKKLSKRLDQINSQMEQAERALR